MGTVNDELDRIAALDKEMLVPTDIAKYLWCSPYSINVATEDGRNPFPIDNDKGYSPDNCRWADMTTQVGNRSCCRKGESV